MPATVQTPSEHMSSATPQWQAEPFIDPASTIRRDKTRPARRPPPVNVNLPAPRNPSGSDGKLESIGGGYPVYLPPDSDDNRRRVRSIKADGGGVAVLKEASDDDEELVLRGVKAKEGSPLTVRESDDGKDVEVGGNDVRGSVDLGMGGQIVVLDGIVTAINQGGQPGSGSFLVQGCDGEPQTFFTWVNGAIVESGPIVISVGECNATQTEGS